MNRVEQSIFECIGRNAADTLQRLILSMPEIAAIKTSEYAHLPLVQDRPGPSDAEQAIVRQAIKHRADTNLPFWDSVMLSVANSEHPVEWLLDTASTHISLRGE